MILGYDNDKPLTINSFFKSSYSFLTILHIMEIYTVIVVCT